MFPESDAKELYGRMKKNPDPVFLNDLREQLLYLRDLGVNALKADLPCLETDAKARQAANPERRMAPATESIRLPKTESPDRRITSRLDVLPSLSNRPRPKVTIGGIMGPKPAIESETAPSRPSFDNPLPLLADENETIENIRAEIGDCKRCPLHKLGRKQIVHTTGNFSADLMFIGEGPGADEDELGAPFVGRAGQLLTKIIESIGLRREEVCIGNIVRCRPPNNRKPQPEEVAACRPFILREIAIVKPKVIVVLGATAAHNLLQVNTPISQLRGHFHDYFGVRVMPTFHPAYLLRDPHKKRDVWEDMKKVRDELARLKNSA